MPQINHSQDISIFMIFPHVLPTPGMKKTNVIWQVKNSKKIIFLKNVPVVLKHKITQKLETDGRSDRMV